MQFMPEIPTAVLESTDDPEYSRLVPQARAYVEDAVAAGTVDPSKRFAITKTGDEVSVSNVPDDLAEYITGTIDEINALLGDALPEMYTRDGVSQVEESIWEKHLSDHWGF